jgi:hypothetical protein
MYILKTIFKNMIIIKSHKEEHTPWHTIVMIFYE